jgi:hypothetical protein
LAIICSEMARVASASALEFYSQVTVILGSLGIFLATVFVRRQDLSLILIMLGLLLVVVTQKDT